MRMELIKLLGPDVADGDVKRDVGAAVARHGPAGGVLLELGPADGPPFLRLSLTTAEATRLSAALQAIVNGRDEEIMLAEA